jgi:hypothetical protein
MGAGGEHEKHATNDGRLQPRIPRGNTETQAVKVELRRASFFLKEVF